MAKEEKKMTTLNLNDANPFEALGSLMSELASETMPAGNSGEFCELAILERGGNPVEVRLNAMALFMECSRILQLPFLSEHNSAVESHRNYLDIIRENFLRMAFSYESVGPLNNFRGEWDAGRWAVMSQSVKSFRLMHQNYELIELVTKYLNALREFLLNADKSQPGVEALEILTDILRSIDRDLWKTSWETYIDRFARLDVLLQAESKENPDSPSSTFFRATREAMWRVFNRANQAVEVMQLVSRAHNYVNIALIVGSTVLPSESKQLVEGFIDLMNHTNVRGIESGEIVGERNALPEAPISDEVE